MHARITVAGDDLAERGGPLDQFAQARRGGLLRPRQRPAITRTALRAVAPGSLVAFLDNRYVEGSSTPVSRRDGTAR